MFLCNFITVKLFRTVRKVIRQ